MKPWYQFISHGLAQLAGRTSLRDVVSNLKAQASKLYHLVCGEVSRSATGQGQQVTILQAFYEALIGDQSHGEFRLNLLSRPVSNSSLLSSFTSL